MMIKVFIVDDHAVVRQGLKQILAEESRMTVVGEAANGVEAPRKIQETNPDVVILDISLPGRNGIDVLRRIKADAPNRPVLVLSMYPEDQYAVRLLKDGAAGYLTKESAPEQLVTAIRAVASGKKYISPAVAELMLNEMVGEGTGDAHESLSRREYQVFVMLASGKTTTEIAKDLCLSTKSITTYRARVLRKMNLRNNVELTHYAIKHGFVF